MSDPVLSREQPVESQAHRRVGGDEKFEQAVRAAVEAWISPPAVEGTIGYTRPGLFAEVQFEYEVEGRCGPYQPRFDRSADAEAILICAEASDFAKP